MEHFFTNTQIHEHLIMRFLLLLLVSLPFCCFSQNSKAFKLYEKGNELAKERAFIDAKKKYKDAISADKTYEAPYKALMRVYTIYKEEENVIELKIKMIENLPFKEGFKSYYFEIAQYYYLNDIFDSSTEYLNLYFSKVNDTHKHYSKAKKIQSNIQSISSRGHFDKPERLFKKLSFVSYPIAISDTELIANVRYMVGGRPETVIAKSTKTAKGWSELVSFSSAINTYEDQGGCTFSKDGKTMIFTSSNRRDGFGGSDLYQSTKDESGEWYIPINLGKEVNSPSWESEPSLSADGKKLFFSSRRAGGYGKEDIWVTEWTISGWSIPVNLGPSVNTKGREVTPFIHPYGTQLYYASTTESSLGGFDIYVSNYQDSTWTKGENLGYPINSPLDESGLTLSENSKQAYFARFEKTKGIDKLSTSKVFSFVIPDSLHASKPVEKEEPIIYTGVLFDYDKSELKPEFKQQLDNLFLILTKERPNANIIVEGHTDNEGTNESNLILSKSRAKAVADYLTGKGIESTRITTVGKGASSPVTTNDTEEGRAKNRRIEIIFVE